MGARGKVLLQMPPLPSMGRRLRHVSDALKLGALLCRFASQFPPSQVLFMISFCASFRFNMFPSYIHFPRPPLSQNCFYLLSLLNLNANPTPLCLFAHSPFACFPSKPLWPSSPLAAWQDVACHFSYKPLHPAPCKMTRGQ